MLDPEAAALLAYVDRLADARPDGSDALTARIDAYGVVSSTIALCRGAELFLQAGDGWDRVLWTCPSRRVYDWTWRERETPEDLDALLSGRGIDRTSWLGQRLAGAQLIVEGRPLATSEGTLRLALLRRLGIRLRERDAPAL
ncbi:MAG TPA: hypothetical protein VNA28_17060 [Solirubrobacteraceae bacterium]|nr:hypothetical protein [Solirubrobacteraceae bacterium]